MAYWKQLGLLSVFVVMLCGTALARDAGADERDLLRVETAVCAAFETGDATELRKHLDAGFTLTNSRGEVADLAQNLAEVSSREPRYDVFRNHGQHVRLYGEAAIITGVTEIKGQAGGKPIAANFQYTDTWIRRDGRWLLAASHASRLPE